MYSYSLIQWILFFYIYCFLGWIIESTIVSVTRKKLVNRGFLIAPMLPLYGTGAILILFVSLPVKDNIFLVYFFGMIAATILEYFTGWLMETLLKMKYWDYTNDKFNYKGRICLECSLFWGVLAIVLTFLVHTPIENLVLNTSLSTIKFIVIFISIFFSFDFIYSSYNAINLTKILSFITKIKEELDSLSDQLKSTSSNYDVAALKSKFSALTSKYENLTSKIKFSHKQILKAYPKSISNHFNGALKELKNKVGLTKKK